MITRAYPARRMVMQSRRSFADALATMERLVPAVRPDEFAGLVEQRVPAPEIARRVDAMVGELGFLVLARLDREPLVSRLGRAKEMAVFLIGDPVLANRMFARDPVSASMRRFARRSTWRTTDTTSFAYDVPSSLLNSFADPEFDAVARILDDRMARLAEAITE